MGKLEWWIEKFTENALQSYINKNFHLSSYTVGIISSLLAALLIWGGAKLFFHPKVKVTGAEKIDIDDDLQIQQTFDNAEVLIAVSAYLKESPAETLEQFKDQVVRVQQSMRSK